jgi:hypothetical protein
MLPAPPAPTADIVTANDAVVIKVPFEVNVVVAIILF